MVNCSVRIGDDFDLRLFRGPNTFDLAVRKNDRWVRVKRVMLQVKVTEFRDRIVTNVGITEIAISGPRVFDKFAILKDDKVQMEYRLNTKVTVLPDMYADIHVSSAGLLEIVEYQNIPVQIAFRSLI